MTKDEALDLALDALDNLLYWDNGKSDYDQAREAITAIKQVRALDKMAENARELGLDYDPAGGTQVSKVWWEGEKLMAKPIPLKDIYQPAPVQEPVAWINAEKRTFEWNGPVLWNTPTVAVLDKIPLYTTPPAAQRQWVPLTDEELKAVTRLEGANSRAQLDLGKAFWAGARWAEAQLKEKNT